MKVEDLKVGDVLVTITEALTGSKYRQFFPNDTMPVGTKVVISRIIKDTRTAEFTTKYIVVLPIIEDTAVELKGYDWHYVYSHIHRIFRRYDEI